MFGFDSAQPAQLSQLRSANTQTLAERSRSQPKPAEKTTTGVLLPFSIPLTLIPGPNLVLFYLAWRTWSHYQSQKGGRHVLNHLPVQFVPVGD